LSKRARGLQQPIDLSLNFTAEMISKRYYLTILSMIPILLSQVYIARRTLKIVGTRPHRLRLWRTAVIAGAILILVSTFSEFQSPLRFPRLFATSVQTFVNLYGLISVAAVAIFVVLEFAMSWLPVSFRQDRRHALRIIAGAGIAAPIAVVGSESLSNAPTLKSAGHTFAFRISLASWTACASCRSAIFTWGLISASRRLRR